MTEWQRRKSRKLKKNANDTGLIGSPNRTRRRRQAGKKPRAVGHVSHGCRVESQKRMHRDQRHDQAVLLAKRTITGASRGRYNDIVRRCPATPSQGSATIAVRNRIARILPPESTSTTSASAEPTPVWASLSRTPKRNHAGGSPVAIPMRSYWRRNPRPTQSIKITEYPRHINLRTGLSTTETNANQRTLVVTRNKDIIGRAQNADQSRRQRSTISAPNQHDDGG